MFTTNMNLSAVITSPGPIYGSGSIAGSSGVGANINVAPTGAIQAKNGPYTITGVSSAGGYITIDNLSSPEDYSKRSQTLPPIVLESVDDSGKRLFMTLAPEASIAGIDVMRIMMLINAYCRDQNSFWAYKYITNNNLERHFKFEQ